ncbi:MAG: flagellar hook basal-body protein, partial [Planctomycetia bacterium]
MSYGLYISAEGANAQSRRLEVIANNLANIDTVGFKKDLAVCQARFAEGVQEGLELPWMGGLVDQGGGIKLKQTATDFSEGRLKETHRKLDMAIQGEGFFQIQKDGETYLTRAGNFDLTSDGQLVTAQGYPVLNNEGTPIRIDPTEGEWQINDQGMIDQGG